MTTRLEVYEMKKSLEQYKYVNEIKDLGWQLFRCYYYIHFALGKLFRYYLLWVHL